MRLQRLKKSSTGDSTKEERARHERYLRKQPGLQAESWYAGLENRLIEDSVGNQLLLPGLFFVSKAWENLCRG